MSDQQLKSVGLGESRQVRPGASGDAQGAELKRSVEFLTGGPESGKPIARRHRNQLHRDMGNGVVIMMREIDSPVRVFGKCGGLLSDILDGMRWAAGIHQTVANPTPAKVINMSLGGEGTCTPYADVVNAVDAVPAA